MGWGKRGCWWLLKKLFAVQVKGGNECPVRFFGGLLRVENTEKWPRDGMGMCQKSENDRKGKRKGGKGMYRLRLVGTEEKLKKVADFFYMTVQKSRGKNSRRTGSS